MSIKSVRRVAVTSKRTAIVLFFPIQSVPSSQTRLEAVEGMVALGGKPNQGSGIRRTARASGCGKNHASKG